MNREERRAEARRMRNAERAEYPHRVDARLADGGLRNDDPYVKLELMVRRSTWLAVMDRLPPEHQAEMREAAAKVVKELEAERDRLDGQIDELTDQEAALQAQLAELAIDGQLTDAQIEAEADRITREAFVLAGKEKEIPE